MEEQAQAVQTPGGDVSVETSEEQPVKRQLLKQFPPGKPKKGLVMVGAVLLVVFAGVASGWVLSGGAVGGKGKVSQEVPGVEETVKEAGIADEATFRDSAEGILEEGGIDGEGTHHLVRDGGPSKYAYLTSTVIDLQSFVGKKVKVWGETIAARKAGWLMDVGKIKVLE
jgi:hypothetical protein